MSLTSFDELLCLVCEKIRKNDTVMKKSIPPAERLVITLRYLASGMNFRDLEFDFHVSRKTIPLIVKETSLANCMVRADHKPMLRYSTESWDMRLLMQMSPRASKVSQLTHSLRPSSLSLKNLWNK